MRLPRSVGSRIYLLHLAAVAGALLLIVTGSWRTGTLVIGASFLGASAARLVVPDPQSGMLRVRGRAFDVAWMGFLGGALVALALVVPAR